MNFFRKILLKQRILTQRVFRKFLLRISENNKWSDEIELQILCSELFGKSGTLIWVGADKENIKITPLNYERVKNSTDPKNKGSLDIEELMNSNDFLKYSISKGEDLLIGATSILIVGYSRVRETTDIFCVSVNPEKDIELLKKLIKFKTRPDDKDLIYILCKNQTGAFRNSAEEIPKLHVDIQKLYNDDLPYKSIMKKIKDKNRSGVFIFHGPAGTGKSSFIKHLINECNKEDIKVVVIASSFTKELGNPEFITYLRNQDEGTVFVLEDCEKLLCSRDQGGGSGNISDILNLGDGIIGSIRNTKFICTFNTELTNIDDAILRPGRLLERYEFGALCLEKTKALLPEATEAMKLSDIFNSDVINAGQPPKKKIGFN